MCRAAEVEAQAAKSKLQNESPSAESTESPQDTMNIKPEPAEPRTGIRGIGVRRRQHTLPAQT